MISLQQTFFYLRHHFLFADHIHLNIQPAHARLLVVTGENATGKSMVRRVLQSFARNNGCEAIAVSPEFRQEGGFARAMIYGDESYEASGQIACKVVLGSIRTSQGRENEHIVVLDEPDMGLSDNAAAGVADEIMDFMQLPPEKLGFYTIITHRRAMLERFLTMNPSHIRVGDDLTLEQAVNAPITPIRPAELKTRANELFRNLTKVLKK